MKRPFALYNLCLLLFLLSALALLGGILMMWRTDGSLLMLDLERLSQTPFKNYGIPGFLLFVFGGVVPFMALIGSLFKPTFSVANKLNLYQNMHWAWAYSLYSGVIVIIWIVVQQFIMPYFWLQPLFILLGLLIIVVSLLPANLQYFNLTKKEEYSA